MRVALAELNPSLSVTIAGNEAWLDQIYSDFPLIQDERPRLSGALRLVKEEAGTVLVTGSFDYAPIVNCSRCDKGISWPLHVRVNQRFLPADLMVVEREMNLKEGDLEAYYVQDETVDIEGLLNDLVQTSLPMRLVYTSEDGSSCLTCKADLTDELLYGEAPKLADAVESPFAKLKDLKLKN